MLNFVCVNFFLLNLYAVLLALLLEKQNNLRCSRQNILTSKALQLLPDFVVQAVSNEVDGRSLRTIRGYFRALGLLGEGVGV